MISERGLLVARHGRLLSTSPERCILWRKEARLGRKHSRHNMQVHVGEPKMSESPWHRDAIAQRPASKRTWNYVDTALLAEGSVGNSWTKLVVPQLENCSLLIPFNTFHKATILW
jgi:hypothetical protein